MNIVVVFSAFKYNQNYIAANLCENKSRPALKCDGKCYLKKQIGNTQESEQAPISFKKTILYNYFYIKEDFVRIPTTILLPQYTINLPNEKPMFETFAFISRLLVNQLLRPPALS